MEVPCISPVAPFGCAVQNACCKEPYASKGLGSTVTFRVTRETYLKQTLKLWFLVAITTTYVMLLTEQEAAMFLLKAMLWSSISRRLGSVTTHLWVTFWGLRFQSGAGLLWPFLCCQQGKRKQSGKTWVQGRSALKASQRRCWGRFIQLLTQRVGWAVLGLAWFLLEYSLFRRAKSKHLNKVKFRISTTMLSLCFGLALLRKWRCEFTSLGLDCTWDTCRYESWKHKNGVSTSVSSFSRVVRWPLGAVRK